ncbi:MAG: hypothetical protein QM662_14920 [Gordonia sp. (in: high G+C Gram-positive bacteria)]
MSFTLITSADLPESGNLRRAIRDEVAARIADPHVTRLIVDPGAGTNTDRHLAQVIAAVMVAERLDIEVAYVAPQPTAATAIYGLPHADQARELAEHGAAVEVPLIRDDTATVLVGTARHLGEGGAKLHGESYVDNERLFTGEVRAIRIEPTRTLPGVRARLDRPGLRRNRWYAGRAVQTGGTNLVVERDGVLAERVVKRSTFYRHHRDLRLVCR